MIAPTEKETYVTNAQHVRASSRALTVCSVILIIVGSTLAHEVIGAIDGVTTSTAMLAVSASCVSAFVGLVFFVWLARFAPSVLSWIAAFCGGLEVRSSLPASATG